MTRSLLLIALACTAVLRADDVPLGPDGKPRFGHSSHGEAFDEGPRQAASLLPGMGNAHFAVTTKSEEAAKFFDQGVAQLHGFWYYESERSFRQVLKLDPDCAMAYWGLTLSNQNNEKRSAEFIKEALKRKDKASPREQAWISAYHEAYSDGKAMTPEKRKKLVKALEKLIFEFPDDIEARAFLVFHLWDNAQKGIAHSSHTATEALAQSVLAKNPEHPGIHHYLIHLWNYEDDRRALKSAAVLGQTAQGIAHMWHMPGHTFTRLKRYADAVWQQEASARTDHAHMAAARIMPEQIHNYAHNNDWLVENLSFIGRIRDAIDLAKNMVELPRLAKGHVLVGRDGYAESNTGFQMGRRRLLDVLLNWGMWEDLLALDGTQYLEPSEDPTEDGRRLRALAVAAYQTNNIAKGDEKMAAIENAISTAKRQRFESADAAEEDAKKGGRDANKAMADALQKFSQKIETLERYRNEAQLYKAIAEAKPMLEIKPMLEKVKEIPPIRLSRLHLKLGDQKAALEQAERGAKDTDGQVLPLANLADIQWRSGKKDEARATFEKLRPLCAQADLGNINFTRLKPIIDDLKLPADWRPKLEYQGDSGVRPDLAKLGPFRWSPYAAPDWLAVDLQGKTRTSADYKGKPYLLVFYLGSGCSHCIEQLNALGPVAKDYSAAGIDIIAVSTDNAGDLNKTFVQAKDAQGFPFPIVADPGLAAFKAYRAFDDFENQSLHGTFLIDSSGYVRWQDISSQPFSDVKWLLGESKRLLAMPVGQSVGTVRN
ncbi:MAG: Serine/threonine-protein kinase PknD [Verrucomicrobiota bacterium]|jgi:peroxiredoxin/tetratricopeptide (TPR) repeat protein